MVKSEPKDLYYPKMAIGQRVGRDCILVGSVGRLLTIPSLRDLWRSPQRPGPEKWVIFSYGDTNIQVKRW